MGGGGGGEHLTTDSDMPAGMLFEPLAEWGRRLRALEQQVTVHGAYGTIKRVFCLPCFDPRFRARTKLPDSSAARSAALPHSAAVPALRRCGSNAREER